MGSVSAVSPTGSPPPPGSYAPVPAGYGHSRQFSDASSTGDQWTMESGQGLAPGHGGAYVPPLPMQYQDRYGQQDGGQYQQQQQQQQQQENRQDYGQSRYQGSPSPPPPPQEMMGQQQEYHPTYSEMPPQQYQGPRYGGQQQQQGHYEGWR